MKKWGDGSEIALAAAHVHHLVFVGQIEFADQRIQDLDVAVDLHVLACHLRADPEIRTDHPELTQVNIVIAGNDPPFDPVMAKTVPGLQ